jgi:hypothetical protein
MGYRISLLKTMVLAGAALAQCAPAYGSGMLQGSAAQKQLVREGRYDSLVAAYRNARNGAGDNPAKTRAPQTTVHFEAKHPVFLTSGDRYWFELAGFGDPASFAVNGSRAEYKRPAITEWYVNAPEGIEQGFLVERRPNAADEQLVVPLRVRGDINTVEPADDGVVLRLASHSLVRYGGLKATDAAGKLLVSRMEVCGSEVRLVIQDQGARYPVLIDPWIQSGELTEGSAPNPSNDGFGGAIALSGNTAIVAADNATVSSQSGAGAVYVFVNNGSAWVQQQELTEPVPTAGDFFGDSVAVSGDTAIIGAPAFGNGGIASNRPGAAYIFARTGSVWTMQAELSASSPAANDWFGWFVALDDDTALVEALGAPSEPSAVYVFTRNGTLWTQQAALLGPVRGWQSVALSGNTALIGAGGATVDGIPNAGAVDVYTRTGTSWAQTATLAAEHPNKYGFGAFVYLDGNIAVVPENTNAENARVDVFENTGTAWVQQAILTPGDADQGFALGNQGIAISGNTIVVGSNELPSSSNETYVFFNTGGAWIPVAKIPVPASGDLTGGSVVLSGGTLLIDGVATVSGQSQDVTWIYNLSSSNQGSAASIQALRGTLQTAGLDTEFTSPLVVQVTDANGNAVSGVTVDFTAPASGASAAFSTPALTDDNGLTSVTATANSAAGGYTADAGASGVATPAAFSLTNLTPPSVVSVSPSSGAGLAQTFTLAYSDPNGAANLSSAGVIFGSTLASVNSCYAWYMPATNALYMENDAGNGLLGPLAPTSSASLSNSQCTVSWASDPVTLSGDNLTLNLAFTFGSGYMGAKTIFMRALESSADTSGWVAEGTWTAGPAGPPTTVSVNPNSGTGPSQTFTLTYSDPNGPQHLYSAGVIFSSPFAAADSCYAYYIPAHNALYLENDAGDGVLGPLPANSSASLSNSQCTVSWPATNQVTVSGTSLTLNVTVAFNSAYLGQKTIYMRALENSSDTSGWVVMGTWMSGAAEPPEVVSVTPSSGSGLSQTFTMSYSDSNGAAHLSSAGVIFSPSFMITNSCYTYYVPSTKSLYLENDSGNGVLGPLPTDSSASLSNSQCAVSWPATDSVTLSGNSLTLNVAINFKSSFTGAKTIYMRAIENISDTSGWVTEGTWTPAPGGPPTAVSVNPNSGTGPSQAFTLSYSDPNGATNLYSAGVIFSSEFTITSSCYAYYLPATKALYLESDAGNGVLGPLPSSSSASLSNSQCTVSWAASPVTLSGTSLTLNIAITFNFGYTGAKTIYMRAMESSSDTSGWINNGSWTP